MGRLKRLLTQRWRGRPALYDPTMIGPDVTLYTVWRAANLAQRHSAGCHTMLSNVNQELAEIRAQLDRIEGTRGVWERREEARARGPWAEAPGAG